MSDVYERSSEYPIPSFAIQEARMGISHKEFFNTVIELMLIENERLQGELRVSAFYGQISPNASTHNILNSLMPKTDLVYAPPTADRLYHGKKTEITDARLTDYGAEKIVEAYRAKRNPTMLLYYHQVQSTRNNT